ncbi:flagellar hook-associated protein 2 [Clostridia bacterium]|nr:flagellar hook-associated protein 2 [Clostridia bacterium]
MYTNTTRMTGLSGLDTDTLVKQLMAAESIKYNALKKQNTILEWKQEAYRATAKVLSDFQTSFLDLTSSKSLRLTSSFGGFASTVKNALGADSTKIGVATSSNSKEGTYTFEVTSLATKSKFTGFDGAVTQAGNIVSSKNLRDDPGFLSTLEAGDTIKFSLDGTTKTVTITEDFLGSGADNFATKLNDALNAAYKKSIFNVRIGTSAEGGKLSIGVTEKGHDFKIYQGSGDGLTSTAKNTITYPPAIATFSFDVAKTLQDGTPSGPVTINVNFDGSEDNQVKVLARINEAIQAEASGAFAHLKAINQDGKIAFKSEEEPSTFKITAPTSGGDLLQEMGFDRAEITLKKGSTIETLGFSDGDDSTKTFLSKTVGEINPSIFGVPGNTNTNTTFDFDGKSLLINKTDTMQEVMDKINNTSLADVEIKFDSLNYRFTMEAKQEGQANGFLDAGIDDKLKLLFGFVDDTASGFTSFEAAEDAVLTINGVTTTRDSNKFTIDGIGITLKEKTEIGETLTIEVKKDNSKGVDLVKEFVAEYNKLVDHLKTQYETSRPKSGQYAHYDPLTDDEKANMSDKQIELWEEKAKSGLLYRDSLIEKVLSDLRMTMFQKVDVGDGKTLSLQQIGITTGDYTNGGKLIIDENKLKTAFDQRGNDIVTMFTKTSSDKKVKGITSTQLGIGEKVNNVLNAAVGTVDGKDGTFRARAGILGTYSANHNNLTDQIKRQSTKIDDMLTYLIKKEDSYYNMFAKLESAMMQADSQMQYITAQLGM